MALVGRLWARVRRHRLKRRWRFLRESGMHLGKFVNLPLSTWIDIPHCNLISIGDYCGFGEECVILAHDALMNEYIDASRIARVTIHDSCHIGGRSVILPGVEIGPRTIVGSGSVVSKTIPRDSVAAGNPARVLCSMDEFLDKHRARMRERPVFTYEKLMELAGTPEGRAEIARLVGFEGGYVQGGYTALLRGASRLNVTPDPAQDARRREP